MRSRMAAFLLGLGALPADFAEARPEHRRGCDRGGAEGEHDHHDGDKDQEWERKIAIEQFTRHARKLTPES